MPGDNDFLEPAPGLRVTDFSGGELVDDETGNSLPATDLARAIMLHFDAGLRWADFPRRTEGQDTLEALKKAGLLRGSPGDASIMRLVQAETTMFAAPRRSVDDILAGDIVFLGAPIDMGTTAVPGARFGPDAIRAASVERYKCDYDLRTRRLKGWNVPNLGGSVLTGARMCDLGDLQYRPGTDPLGYHASLRHILGKIYARGAFPVILGGDHSLTYGTAHPDADILLHLDAHSDMAAYVPGTCHHHGNVLARLISEGLKSRIVHVGLRDTSGADTAEAGSLAYSADPGAFPVILDGVGDKSVFVTLDLDVLDPAVLPGTGTPVPGGFHVRELCGLLCQVIACARPLGLDVVELCPMRDVNEVSSQTAVELILVFLAMYHKHHGQESCVEGSA